MQQKHNCALLHPISVAFCQMLICGDGLTFFSRSIAVLCCTTAVIKLSVYLLSMLSAFPRGCDAPCKGSSIACICGMTQCQLSLWMAFCSQNLCIRFSCCAHCAAVSQGLPAGSSAFRTKRQEAKAAADAAAAAAADACAVCDKLYGEDADRDDTWIACDRCNRWYHGFCVDMTQVRAE